MFLVILGSAFLLAGVGVDVAAALGVIPSELLLMGSIFVLTGAILDTVGLMMVRSSRARARLLATGLAGTARITSVRQTNVMVNNQPVIAFELLVAIPGRPEYPARHREVVPLIRLGQVQPGTSVAVRVDPQRPERVVIDWGASVPGPVSSFAVPGYAARLAASGGVVPGTPAAPPPVPSVPEYAAGLPMEQLREHVRSVGAPGRAIIDAVEQVGPEGDKIGYRLGMWVQLDSGPSYHVEHAPAAVEPRYAVLVRPGVAVPLRMAQVRPGVTVTVLEWEKLSD